MKRFNIPILLLGVAMATPSAATADSASSAIFGPAPTASAGLAQRFELARSLYASRNYRGTIHELRSIAIASELPLPPREESEFVFLLGSASFMADLPEALELLQQYLDRYPAGEEAVRATLLTADFHFFAHEWSEALEIYRTVDLGALDSSAHSLYTYREALSMIKCGFYSEALPLLDIIGADKEYALQAKYYRAYIYYVDGRDEKAMRLFRETATALTRTQSGPERLAPDYYIAQLLFRQGDWKEAASMASSLLKSGDQPELELPTLRILGMSRYESGDYRQASSPLERYVREAGDDASHDALYALGVCRYRDSGLTEAEECFQRVVRDNDAVGQGASLYLGQIAASRGDASAAAMHFERAYRMNYDNRVAETALYDYVAARARGGNIPFDSNVEMLEEFIRNYPNSEYAPVIERHLATLYYNDGDYDNALRVAERIRRPSADDSRLLQTILYSGGTSALSAGNPAKASRWLDKCVKISDGDPFVRAQAYIWLGDARYDLGDYREAEAAYRTAEKSGRAGDNSTHLKYNLGYALMMQNKFKEASAVFSTILSSSLSIPDDMRRDVMMRLADCKYYAGDYAGAMRDFAALRSGGHAADYAIYRHAQLLGIQGDLSGKIAELERLASEYGNSRWMSNALTELADTYVANGQQEKAAATYRRMLDRYPVDPAAPRAQLGLGASLTASGDPDGGAEAYREVLRRWPSSEQARIADAELREYYAERHRLPEYAEFLRSIPGFSIDAAEMESLAYNVAEREYLDNPSSALPLTVYLHDYPDGAHSAEAWALLALHYYDAKDFPNALAAYRELEKRGGAEYAIEAYTGIMRTADNTAVRAEYARKLHNSGGASADAVEEADFYLAEASLAGNSAAERRKAEATLKKLAENPFSEFGARSAVALGEYMLAQRRPQEARDLMQEFTSAGSSQQYWVARGFIVLADAFSALGDDYMAREYLRSLKRNYPGDEEDIRREIDRRLD